MGTVPPGGHEPPSSEFSQSQTNAEPWVLLQNHRTDSLSWELHIINQLSQVTFCPLEFENNCSGDKDRANVQVSCSTFPIKPSLVNGDAKEMAQ